MKSDDDIKWPLTLAHAIGDQHMKKMFKLGCAGLGIQASSMERPVSLVELPILEQFKLVKEAQVWDFIDRIPNNRQELDEYIKGSQLYDLPVLSGSGCYTLGLDEAVIRKTWISP
jgi:hypothetical protein